MIQELIESINDEITRCDKSSISSLCCAIFTDYCQLVKMASTEGLLAEFTEATANTSKLDTFLAMSGRGFELPAGKSGWHVLGIDR